MADSGTTCGPELLVALSPEAGTPLRGQLESALRHAVRAGRLASGQRLPASRVLAADLGVSRRLVVDVYDQLTAEGYLTARAGSGAWVSDLATPTDSARTSNGSAELPPLRWDLRPGVPSLAHFPRQQWRRAWLSALTGACDADLGYPQAAGHSRLREAVAAYLNRVRGVAATPATTLICAGFTQGLDLLCRTLRAGGARTVALEDPGLPHRARIVRHAGLTPLPVPVDADGLVVTALPDHGVDAVLTTPAHQFPTGAVLASHRREALLAWAGRAGALVLEDDYDGEFRFDRRAIGALQGLAPNSVVYLGSTSKTLAPALRLGWLVSPPQLVGRLTAGKFLTDHGTATLDQLALTEMINSGAYDRHIRQTRSRYKAQREALEAAVSRHHVPLRLTGVPAGVQTLATLLGGHDGNGLVRRAATDGIALDSVTRYHLAPGKPARSLVIGYGNITPHGIDRAMAALARIMDAEPPQ
ncbi:GntR family transcriptional regulator [Streptomyces albospinus]|uniref:GntR family transcriptional regulator n=1 Tax=Streptomyces albospinus TaxID=285515 RepID=A0ABQ2V4T8_9ACTN|nr:PLP-dependent aminotransferase family protein [Streptomyces albospinus]GGU65416.1 GntR family transcriptional regulator [Streptomyces albospinus]